MASRGIAAKNSPVAHKAFSRCTTIVKDVCKTVDRTPQTIKLCVVNCRCMIH